VGIRQKLNDNPAITRAAAIALTVLALGYVWYEVHHASGPKYQSPTGRYFSDDDGASYFSDSLTLIPPFDHDGKQAVTANVFRCKDAKPFIAFLQRYTAKGIQELKSPQNNGNNSADLERNQSEISPPLAGDKGWVKAGSNAGQALMNNLKCPDGSSDDIEPVLP
jgi:hypothetical protein